MKLPSFMTRPLSGMARLTRNFIPKKPSILKRTRYSVLSREAMSRIAGKEQGDIGQIVEEMDKDYQVKLAKLILSANIQAAASTVTAEATPDGRTARIVKHQQKLWDQTLPVMLQSIAYGRVAFEKCWAYQDGITFIESLDDLPFTKTSLKLGKDGQFDGIELKESETEESDKKSLNIPAPNVWWLALDPTAMQPHGRSRYLGAPHDVWKERRTAIRLRRVFVRKLMVGGGVIYAPFQTEIEDGQTLDTAAALADVHAQRQSGDAVIVPNTRDKVGNREFEVVSGTDITDAAPIDNHIDGLDQDQLQAFGIPPKTVLEGDSVGSHAMVSQQMLTLFAVCEDILKQLEASFQKYVIDKEVAENFEADHAPHITISHQPLAERPDSSLLQVMTMLITSPQMSELATSGVVDVPQILERAGAPLAAEAKAAWAALVKRSAERAASQQQQQFGGPPGGGFGMSLENATYDLCGGKGGKPGPCPWKADDAPTATRAPKSERALASHKPSTREKQRYAIKNEHSLTNALGARKSFGNAPVDLSLRTGNALHGIELKTMLDNGSDKITVHPESRRRKEDWAKRFRAKLHTVVLDHRDRFSDGANKHQHSGHEIYYKRGVGAFNLSNMHRAKDMADLQKLLSVDDDKLPAKARTHGS